VVIRDMYRSGFELDVQVDLMEICGKGHILNCKIKVCKTWAKFWIDWDFCFSVELYTTKT
jgi:hypothetical protein